MLIKALQFIALHNDRIKKYPVKSMVKQAQNFQQNANFNTFYFKLRILNCQKYILLI